MALGIFILFMGVALLVLQTRPAMWVVPFAAVAPLFGLMTDYNTDLFGWSLLNQLVHWSVVSVAIVALLVVHERRSTFGLGKPMIRVVWLFLFYLLGGVLYALLPQPTPWLWAAETLLAWFFVGVLPPLLIVHMAKPGGGTPGAA